MMAPSTDSFLLRQISLVGLAFVEWVAVFASLLLMKRLQPNSIVRLLALLGGILCIFVVIIAQRRVYRPIGSDNFLHTVLIGESVVSLVIIFYVANTSRRKI